MFVFLYTDWTWGRFLQMECRPLCIAIGKFPIASSSIFFFPFVGGWGRDVAYSGASRGMSHAVQSPTDFDCLSTEDARLGVDLSRLPPRPFLKSYGDRQAIRRELMGLLKLDNSGAAHLAIVSISDHQMVRVPKYATTMAVRVKQGRSNVSSISAPSAAATHFRLAVILAIFFFATKQRRLQRL